MLLSDLFQKLLVESLLCNRQFYQVGEGKIALVSWRDTVVPQCLDNLISNWYNIISNILLTV